MRVISWLGLFLPTFYVARKSPNQLMTRILQMARNTRSSHRYSGYVRITSPEYRRALLRLLREDAADLIDLMQMKPVMEELERRIDDPGRHAVDRRLTRTILQGCGAKNPLKVKGREFNQYAETYYRQDLRRKHIKEAFTYFRQAVGKMDSWSAWRSGQYNRDLLSILGGRNLEDYLAAAERAVVNENLSPGACEKLIGLLLLVFHQSKNAAELKESR